MLGAREFLVHVVDLGRRGAVADLPVGVARLELGRDGLRQGIVGTVAVLV